MAEARLLLELAGEAALLLWGLHMVQSGVQRAFGSRLRRLLGVGLGGPLRAAASGLVATAALQSSTATALMVGSFAAAGAVALGPALAAMLGANVGTALIVQALSFDAAAASAPLVLVGVVAFRRARRTRTRDLGRVAIGLGLMLLALHLMGQTTAPLESSPALRGVLAAVADHPLPNLVLAALVAWAAHSSVAGVLFVASLAGAGAAGPEAALAMVLGANLGSAVNPLLGARGEAGGAPADPARLRVAVGNLANRLAGCALGLAVLPHAAVWLAALDQSPARLVANAHLAFNLATAALGFALLPALAAALRRLLPERSAAADEGAARYLDESALDTPPVALANAAREVLRMADAVEAMLRRTAEAFQGGGGDRDAARAVGRQDDVVDRLHRAVQGYLARIPAEALGEEEARRLAEVRAFAIALEHAGDVVERDLVRHAAKLARRGLALDPGAAAEVAALHARLREQMRLAVAVFVLEDVEAARALVRGKEGLRAAERLAAGRVSAAAAEDALGGDPSAGAAAGLLLDAVRDARRVGAHLAAVAHPLLERRGELLPSRLAAAPAGNDPYDTTVGAA